MSGSTSSGSFGFGMGNVSVVLEAFDRINIHYPEINSHLLLSARTSLNLEFIDWENAGYQFWKTASGTIPLVAGQATYTLPTNLVTVENVEYTAVNAFSSGVNMDRIMTPIQQQQYAEITNKLQQGIPTTYWAQMTYPQQLTIWAVPAAGQVAPNFVLSWFGLQQMQDATMGQGETPDVPRRALDALCARMAMRLAEKFRPELLKDKVALAEEAWARMQRRDQEPGPIYFQPRVGVYGHIP